MKIDEQYHYFVIRANMASAGGASLNKNKYLSLVNSYVDEWSEKIASEIQKINISGGIKLLNLPES